MDAYYQINGHDSQPGGASQHLPNHCHLLMKFVSNTPNEKIIAKLSHSKIINIRLPGFNNLEIKENDLFYFVFIFKQGYNKINL